MNHLKPNAFFSAVKPAMSSSPVARRSFATRMSSGSSHWAASAMGEGFGGLAAGAEVEELVGVSLEDEDEEGRALDWFRGDGLRAQESDGGEREFLPVDACERDLAGFQPERTRGLVESGERVRRGKFLRDERCIERQAIERTEAAQKPEDFRMPNLLLWQHGCLLFGSLCVSDC